MISLGSDRRTAAPLLHRSTAMDGISYGETKTEYRKMKEELIALYRSWMDWKGLRYATGDEAEAKIASVVEHVGNLDFEIIIDAVKRSENAAMTRSQGELKAGGRTDEGTDIFTGGIRTNGPCKHEYSVWWEKDKDSAEVFADRQRCFRCEDFILLLGEDGNPKKITLPNPEPVSMSCSVIGDDES